MATLAYSEAFQSFGAKLVNPQWAYSAIANDGALVMSCWEHKLKLKDKVLSYTDRLSRRKMNLLGKNLLFEHLTKARDESLQVRLVIVTTKETAVVDRGDDASFIEKTFHLKPEVVGKVVLFDDDNFVIEFRRK